MITIKIPYLASNEFYKLLEQLQREYSIVVRYAFNRFKEKKSEKEIRKLTSDLKNINHLNAWMIQNAIRESKQIYTKNKNSKVIFGGKNLFLRWIKTKNKKWLENWKEQRNLPFTIQGEKIHKGNRNFELNIITDNEIIFKYSRTEHFHLKLPKIRKNLKKQLQLLEEKAKNKEITFMIKINKNFIWITFDEEILKEKYVPIKNRIASIDMNPNYIGFVIKDYNTNKFLWKEIISLKELNDKEKEMKGLPSTDKKRIKLNNIRKHLIFEISKRMINIAKHFKVEAFGIEDLKIKTNNKRKGKKFNKLVNNQWLRNDLVNNLNKRCKIHGIKLIKVYPQYSSTIGCLLNPNEVDSIASAIEIGRRTFELINWNKNSNKSVIFPIFDKIALSCLWKDKMKQLILSAKDWKDLHNKIKKLGLRYRFLLNDLLKQANHDAVFNLHKTKTYINLYQFVL